MPSYSTQTVAVTRREFVVPCYGESKWDGAAWAEVAKAMHAARTELESAGVSVGDDTIMVRPGDASIIVYYVTDEAMSDVPVVAARNDILTLRNQLRASERELVALVGEPGAGLSATMLARLERQLGDVQRALRQSEGI